MEKIARTPQTAFGGQLPFTGEPFASLDKGRGTACGGGVLPYEPRVTRGDVVTLSLSRRNAASESETTGELWPAKPLSQLR